MLTWLDESYGHQLVAPRAVTAHRGAKWAERSYYLLHLGDDLTVNVGMQLYPHEGRRAGVVGVASSGEQLVLRREKGFEFGEDPDDLEVGPLSIAVIDPLRELRLSLQDSDFPVRFDLTYEARFDPLATDVNRIEQDGVMVTEYMNFFQSGVYRGVIEIEGEERRVEGRSGFRDRGWGVRKHEGAPRRGFVALCACELRASCIYFILYETASGRRVLTNGWLVDEEGGVDVAVEVEHDFEFDGTLLQGGRVKVGFESGISKELEVEVRNRLFLSGTSYTRERERVRPGTERYDLMDGATVSALEGQTDNGCNFVVGGEEGYGFVETGLGLHARYRPG